jgi:ABC-2 type transport system ATP-binding protein
VLALGTPQQVREQAGASADMNSAFIAIVEKGRAQRQHAASGSAA